MAYQTGYVPPNPSRWETMVKRTFRYIQRILPWINFVAGSIKQLQRTLGRVTDSLLGRSRSWDKKSLTNMFLDISLGYVDECCFRLHLLPSGSKPL